MTGFVSDGLKFLNQTCSLLSSCIMEKLEKDTVCYSCTRLSENERRGEKRGLHKHGSVRRGFYLIRRMTTCICICIMQAYVGDCPLGSRGGMQTGTEGPVGLHFKFLVVKRMEPK